MFCVMLYFTNHANVAPVCLCARERALLGSLVHMLCARLSAVGWSGWQDDLGKCQSWALRQGLLSLSSHILTPAKQGLTSLFVVRARGGAVNVCSMSVRGGQVGIFALERVVWMPHCSARVCVSRA
jgi:hypothetical protein